MMVPPFQILQRQYQLWINCEFVWGVWIPCIPDHWPGNSSLTWIIRDNVPLAPIAPTLATGYPHSMEHGSVKLEVVHRLPHTHNIYAEYNMTVCSHILEVTLGTQYAATISPFKRSRNWRGSYLSPKYQFMRPARWYQDIKETINFMVNRKWTGNTVFSLQKFLNHNCSSYTMLQYCTEHVQRQWHDTINRVKCILYNVDYEDSDVQA